MNNTETDLIEVIIDGKPCTAKHGEFIFDVARRNGIIIPSLCRHDGFDHRAACRLCIVEVIVRGRKKVVTSCAFPIEQPCEVITNSESILEQRRVILMLLQARSPEAKRIKDLCTIYKVDLPDAFVTIDNEKCILCGLCMQACDSLGTGAISTVLRGIEKKVSTPYDKPNEACIGCLSCAEICPTKAIPWSQDEDTRTIWGRTFDLAKCDRCGEVLGTVESFEWTEETADIDEPHLCKECRRKAVADSMLQTYARNDSI